MDSKEQGNYSPTTPRRTFNDFSQEYKIANSSQDTSQFSEIEGTNEFGLNNPDLIVGRYLIYDSRTRRCYARNNSSIEINTPRDGNHISKMVDAILGCASPNSVKEVIDRSSSSRPRIPLPEPSVIPPPPPYPPSVVSAFSHIPLPTNSPPLVSVSPFSLEPPSTPRGSRQVIQTTPKSTPRQFQNTTTLADNDSPPYSPFPDSHFAQFDVPSPPISDSYYSDDSEFPYSSISVHNSPTTPRKNIIGTSPSFIQCYSHHLRNSNESSYDHSRKVRVMSLINNNELSPSPNYRINSSRSR